MGAVFATLSGIYSISDPGMQSFDKIYGMNEMIMKRLLKFYLPALLWAGLIFYLSHQSYIQTPELGINFTDKLGHFGVYAILGYLIIRATTLNQPKKLIPRNLIFSAILALLYGASDEFHQYFIPGRCLEFDDFIADALGAIVAIMIFFWIKKRIQKKLKSARQYKTTTNFLDMT